MGKEQERWGLLIGKWGLVARSIIFGLIGAFIVKAAVDWNVSEAVGIGNLLGFLKNLTFGPLIVEIISLGLMAFGAFSIFSAKYVKFPEE